MTQANKPKTGENRYLCTNRANMSTLDLKHRELLKLEKIAFLCSQVSAMLNHQLPASAVLKCYDWARKQLNS